MGLRKCASKDLSATLVGIVDAFGDPPIDLLRRLSSVSFNIFVSWQYADCSFSLPICSFPSGLNTLEQKENMRSIGNSANGFFCSVLLDSVHAFPQTSNT
ncbi:hypothetical protein H5410_057701 [Solanum commersonii]|uniref:Uncharacterized protein n=1 Tax=Solanum commersonii TaxID=4109 RepID=A0A9J5WQS1_SOLCO|nr:hypothetical protein H5410_057701 [Solanum commersonii]